MRCAVASAIESVGGWAFSQVLRHLPVNCATRVTSGRRRCCPGGGGWVRSHVICQLPVGRLVVYGRRGFGYWRYGQTAASYNWERLVIDKSQEKTQVFVVVVGSGSSSSSM